MPYLFLAIILLSTIIFYCIFVVSFRNKLNNIENELQTHFKKRNTKIISLYYISKNFLNKHDDIFKNFIELKRKDFSEDILKFYFENKINTYKDFHKEINFIFKLCEMNWKIRQFWEYNYIKSEILKESSIVWKWYEDYKKILEKYRKHHKISKFFIVWFFLR